MPSPARLAHRVRAVAITVGMIVVVGAAGGGCSQEAPTAAQAIRVPAESKEDLERAKLAAEIASIRAADEDRRSSGAQWLRWAPFITALVGLGALAAAVIKQGADTRLHRSKELAEQRAERTRRYDETLNAVVRNLGSSEARVRLNAAASLAPLLRLSEAGGGTSGSRSRRDRGNSATPWIEAVPAEDLLPVFVANLRTETDDDVIDTLVRNLGLTLVKLHRSGGVPDGLDLTRMATVRRLRIPAISLAEVDVAFSYITNSDLSDVTAKRLRGIGADLSRTRFTGANLQEARLNESRCVRTRFHRTELVSATFKGANLTAAKFHQASLQSAHFEDAICHGTDFTQADVADAWFCDSNGQRKADLDEPALQTLAQAKRWPDAHLPTEYREYLEQVVSSTRRAAEAGVTGG